MALRSLPRGTYATGDDLESGWDNRPAVRSPTCQRSPMQEIAEDPSASPDSRSKKPEFLPTTNSSDINNLRVLKIERVNERQKKFSRQTVLDDMTLAHAYVAAVYKGGPYKRAGEIRANQEKSGEIRRMPRRLPVPSREKTSLSDIWTSCARRRPRPNRRQAPNVRGDPAESHYNWLFISDVLDGE